MKKGRPLTCGIHQVHALAARAGGDSSATKSAREAVQTCALVTESALNIALGCRYVTMVTMFLIYMCVYVCVHVCMYMGNKELYKSI
jgi:hypothetical protein